MKYELKDTAEWMLSDDYKLRLKAEYWQLVIRMYQLKKYLVQNYLLSIRQDQFESFNNKELAKLFAEQFGAMNVYRIFLEEGAALYDVDLDNDGVQFIKLIDEDRND